jgi:hypothetical protein
MELWPVINFALWHRYWIERESIEALLPREPGPAEAHVA